MLNISKLATLTWLSTLIGTPRLDNISQTLDGVLEMLDTMKAYTVSKPTQSRHELIQMQSRPSTSGSSDSTTADLFANVKHPLVGQAISVKGFVE
jgi:hypothetical protein